ncbi:hypothetical protein E5720_06940 [Rhodococcus sp. PAMC28707]|uniref:hypothetical protein n=1 Tax=unclassified Rhodococcus (in: high G+C Gram-positive bacteria) TaxID=192944 RepID=UPI00109DE643|nr:MULTISPECIES: hypothetical protein [unclassified Rhodococcus (in: high G+C Gram-positive bacteria)]QCB50021.1 hypothetical protein E5769_07075 [Rhodococcus sp. PAMC28705]QCB58284.1 hypothetical protein E5720_06940 [Rhodococcus sp. PAMC28707]
MNFGAQTWTTRIDVSAWEESFIEVQGSHAPRWLIEPGDFATPVRWLHKDVVSHYNAKEDRYLERGEDWSEILATQVAHALGLPVAHTRMCSRGGKRGTISRDVRPEGFDLWNGAVVMEDIDGYVRHAEGSPATDPERPDVKRPGHTLSNIKMALGQYEPPRTVDRDDGLTSFDVFGGYTVLDALVSNRDRHEENWAVVVPQLTSMSARLAPSYDHASCLGFNLNDRKRAGYLLDLAAFAEGGTAHRFEHIGRPPTLVDHASEALKLCSEEGRNWWVSRLLQLDLTPVLSVLERKGLPDMSDLEAKFALELLTLNLRRLRDVVEHYA